MKNEETTYLYMIIHMYNMQYCEYSKGRKWPLSLAVALFSRGFPQQGVILTIKAMLP